MLPIKTDLTTTEDIKLMVDTFYTKVKADPLLEPIFNDFAEVDWDRHLPIMYAFWEKVLFGEGEYNGNPFRKHYPLPVEARHFTRWLVLFERNMDLHFTGQMAESAKMRARSIAHIFQSKLAYMRG